MTFVFISYLHEDSEKVEEISRGLADAGISVWRDKEHISVGERWQTAIRRGIQDGAYFLACFSSSREMRNKSYMNEELLLAIEEIRQRPHDQAWFLPARLDECEIPDIDVAPGITLRSFQWVDFFPETQVGVTKLLEVIDPEGILNRWTQRLNGAVLGSDSRVLEYYLYNELQRHNVSCDRFRDETSFLEHLAKHGHAIDFVVLVTDGGDNPSLREMAASPSQIVAAQFPHIIVIVVTWYPELPQAAWRAGISDKALLKSASLPPNQLATEINTDVRRIVRERTSARMERLRRTRL